MYSVYSRRAKSASTVAAVSCGKPETQSHLLCIRLVKFQLPTINILQKGNPVISWNSIDMHCFSVIELCPCGIAK